MNLPHLNMNTYCCSLLEVQRYYLFQEQSSKTSKNLPSIVFASKGQEENIGLLNKAAPTGLSDLLEWDPDIVETLDDNFNHEVVYHLKGKLMYAIRLLIFFSIITDLYSGILPYYETSTLIYLTPHR